jgi:rubredoxin
MTNLKLQKYICTNCGYVYDPENGDTMNHVPPGTAFEHLPEGWVCPVCYVTKDLFDPLD